MLSRYTEKANTIEQEDSLVNIQAVQVDCSPLKSLLVQHCSDWQTKFTQLLKDKASSRLRELFSLMHSSDRWEERPPSFFKKGFYVKHNVLKSRAGRLCPLLTILLLVSV